MRKIDEGAPLNWAINGRFLTQRVTGVQRYALEIVAALDQLLVEQKDIAKRFNVRLIVPPRATTDLLLSRISVQRTKAGSGHAWDQLVLPAYAGSSVLSLGNFGPVLARDQIVCIHDANVFIVPESYSRGFRLAYCNLLPLVGKRARRIATVSQFSADMLVKFGVSTPDKIFIAPNGHEHALRWDATRSRNPILASMKRPFVLLLGSRARHKNIEIVLDQAEALEAAGIDIIVVGGGSDIFAAGGPASHRANVHDAGYVSDDDLAALYERALCLVFPSKTEGFGIPPLEAMARGCPVISSKAPSLVEVGGDAVAYVDADRSDDWRDAIIALAGNGARRATMAAAGRTRAGLFSWKRSAQKYLDEMLRLQG
jgi:glycosyltransferase involved in cell wall biosynthesis